MRGTDRRRLPPATLDMIGAEMVKLCRHVDALEKSVTRLAGRIDPSEDEKEPAGRPRIDFQIFKNQQGATLDAVFSLLRQVDARVGSLELDFNAMRAKVDQISNDSWSRDDLKKYLDKDHRR
jgi:hypothetical protein